MIKNILVKYRNHFVIISHSNMYIILQEETDTKKMSKYTNDKKIKLFLQKKINFSKISDLKKRLLYVQQILCEENSNTHYSEY